MRRLSAAIPIGFLPRAINEPKIAKEDNGEALVAGGPPGTAAEPEVAIGEMDGPVGPAVPLQDDSGVGLPGIAACWRCSIPTSWFGRRQSA